MFSGGDMTPAKKKPATRSDKKVGRNALCPCGSGKKYKKCCGDGMRVLGLEGDTGVEVANSHERTATLGLEGS